MKKMTFTIDFIEHSELAIRTSRSHLFRCLGGRFQTLEMIVYFTIQILFPGLGHYRANLRQHFLRLNPVDIASSITQARLGPHIGLCEVYRCWQAGLRVQRQL